MHIQPWMVVAWAALSAALVVVMIYRATLTQHETDQLFLNDEESVSHANQEHQRILARMRTIRPLCQGLTGATVLMSALIAGIYVVEMWPYVHMFQ